MSEKPYQPMDVLRHARTQQETRRALAFKYFNDYLVTHVGEGATDPVIRLQWTDVETVAGKLSAWARADVLIYLLHAGWRLEVKDPERPTSDWFEIHVAPGDASESAGLKSSLSRVHEADFTRLQQFGQYYGIKASAI